MGLFYLYVLSTGTLVEYCTQVYSTSTVPVQHCTGDKKKLWWTLAETSNVTDRSTCVCNIVRTVLCTECTVVINILLDSVLYCAVLLYRVLYESTEVIDDWRTNKMCAYSTVLFMRYSVFTAQYYSTSTAYSTILCQCRVEFSTSQALSRCNENSTKSGIFCCHMWQVTNKKDCLLYSTDTVDWILPLSSQLWVPTPLLRDRAWSFES